MAIPETPITTNKKEKPENRWEIENKKLQEDILEVYKESNKVYGAPKIWERLKVKGYEKISLKRVQRHMKKLSIRSIVVKKDRLHSTKKFYEGGKNLLDRDFTTTKINEKWVSNITCVHTQKDGWNYLASILDLHTPKIVGYSFSKTMDL